MFENLGVEEPIQRNKVKQMNDETESVFRKCVARYVKSLRKDGCRTKKEMGPLVVAFCEGWSALSEEMDKITEKYELQNRN